MSFRVMGFAAAVVLTSAAGADFVFFVIDPSGNAGVMLEGTVDTRNSASMLTLRHQRYGDIILPRDQCRIYRAEDSRKKQAAALKSAAKKQDVDLLWKLAKDAIRHGSAGNYFRAAELIGDLDPDHKEAAQARRLAALIDTEIPESKEEERAIRKDSRIESDMQFARSPHFLLMHSIAAKKRKGVKTSVVEERLDMMEKVYKAYLAFFWSRGFEIPVPTKRLFVVLMDTEREFRDHAALQGNPSLLFAEGYFKRDWNVSFFFEHRGTDDYRQGKRLVKELTDVGKERNVSNRGDFVRLGKALELVIEIASEQYDVSTCSHEMTHQMAHNTGLMPLSFAIPRWAAEGFACYFESPRDAQWSGIGAVNKERITEYRKMLKNHHPYCKLDMVVTDRIYTESKSHEEMVEAYAVAWSLTHFLMERHFDRLISYYQKLNKLPKDKVLEHEELEKVFNSCFTSEQLRTMNVDWHLYMTRLRTDLEEVSSDLKLIDD